MNKIILIILCLGLVGMLYQIPKVVLQKLITNNYQLREKGALPDKWYWIDILYFKIYGDYSFYQIKQR